MPNISKIHARQIIDSRGNPTIEVEVVTTNGISAYASSPSGASVGSLEAFELRDNEKSKYHGKSVFNAVKNVNTHINDLLIGLNASEQNTIDQRLIELDGTANKSNLGANATLATSLAIARVASKIQGLPLYKYLRKITSNTSETYSLPTPMMNVINGGVHANNNLSLQEFMIAPVGNKSFSDKLRIGVEIFHHLKNILKSSSHSVNVGDEGGFAPNLNASTEALDFIMKAIEQSGYKPGQDVAIAIDAAASELYNNQIYSLEGEKSNFNSEELTRYYSDLASKYPIYSIEDGMAEGDLGGWKLLTEHLGDKIQLVGDDLIVTNPKILQEIIKQKIANAVLIKPNQIGTLSETLQTIEIARNSNYKTIISHRSGETEDSFIAHLAVATNSDQIKAGSLSRTDRLAKYNELIRIEENLIS